MFVTASFHGKAQHNATASKSQPPAPCVKARRRVRGRLPISFAQQRSCTNSWFPGAKKIVSLQRRALPPVRATSALRPLPRASRAPSSKKLRFASGPPSFGRGRYAVRPHLSCVRSFHFPPLPRPICFLASGQFGVYGII